jgi:hypothetical protein
MDSRSSLWLGNVGVTLVVVSVLWGLVFSGVGLAALFTPPTEEDPLAGALQGIVGLVSIGIGLVGGTAVGLGGLKLIGMAARRAQAAQAPPADAGLSPPQG